MTLDLTVVILTKNESMHLDRALENIKELAKRVLVVDSFSSDDTVVKARKYGADVLENKFINYAKQFQWALDHGDITTKWVMRLDADELIEDNLRHELLTQLPSVPDDIAWEDGEPNEDERSRYG